MERGSPDPEQAGESLKRAIAALGSQVAMAKLLGVTQGAVSKWASRGELPTDHVLRVEAATGVSRHDLRPDIFGAAPELPAQPDNGLMEPAR